MHPDPSKVAGARKVAELPRFVQPQLATLVEKAPQGEEWSHEIKFDGYRALARIENGAIEIRSRNGKEWTDAYRVLADELAALPIHDAILDGEVVAQSPDGTTNFEGLRHLARVPSRETAGRGRREGGGREHFVDRLVYYVFDLLYLDGYELLGAPLEARRGLLRQLLDHAAGHNRIQFSDHIAGDGAAVLEHACSLGLEGVVSKKTVGRYQPGVRGADWVKTKCRHEQEFVIGGFTDPAGARVGFGALLLGVNDKKGLRYVSKVGTGFDDQLLRDLGRRLRALEIDEPPFGENLPSDDRDVHWVRPELVAQVSFLEWTSSGGIRHASFKGLREDKSASDVVAERPAPDRGGAT
jgi:bifunctional non-homologous end joining protein LigD